MRKVVDAKDILGNLVQRAVVFPEDNSLIVDYISSFFTQPSFLIETHPNPRNTKSKSLTIRTDLPDRPYLIFSGHLDVVPNECSDDHSGRWCYALKPPEENQDQKWNVDPKNLTILNDRLYGRGAADMLGGIASLISVFSSINPNKLKYNVAFILTDDEEQELKSIERVLNAIYPKIEEKGIVGCFVCEPTEMKPLVGQRGLVRGKIEFTGNRTHVSRPDLGLDIFKEINAIYTHMLNLCQREQKKYGDDKRFIPHGIYCRIQDIQTDSEFKHSVAGIKLNFMISHLPQHNVKKILKSMHSYVRILEEKLKMKDASTRIKFEVSKSYPSFLCNSNSEFLQNIETLFPKNEILGASFGSEAPVFAEKGIPTILLGPGSILQAHTKNEYIAKTQLEQAKDFFVNYLICNVVSGHSHNLPHLNQIKNERNNRSR